MIFHHSLDDKPADDLKRAQEVCDYIYENIESYLDSDSIIYIVDPYLDVATEVYEPFHIDELDNNVWSYLLGYLIENNRPRNIRILTGWDFGELRDKLRDTTHDLPLEIEHQRGDHCSLLVSKLIKGIGIKSPDELHDRLIIINGKEKKGFHIGPSITDLVRKDCTITCFDDANIDKVLDRIQAIWELSTIIRK